MDLRQKKTLRAITESFYQLRKQKKLEAITVTELCRHAEISKATFYLHYRDIFDLSEKLQTEVIESIFSKIEDPMLVLTDPVTFTNNFLAALESEKERVTILFSDTQAGALPTSIVSHLKAHIYAHSPRHRDNPIIPIYLTYWTMGSYYACMENSGQMDYRQVMKILEDIQPSPPKFD
jgi:AcrR family transcriptional regulator